MLRLLLVLLVLANAGFYAWTQGWLAGWIGAAPPEQREPHRVQAQVRPELITIMTPRAASAALAAAVRDADVCLEAGPFGDTAIAAAEAVLAGNGVPPGSVTRDVVARGPTWAVYIGRFPDREVLRSKADELRRLDVTFEEVSTPPLLAPGLRLSSHADRAAAEAALAQATQKGVRAARVVEVPSAGATQTWLRIPRADGELQARLKALPATGLAGGFSLCSRGPR
jgi:hypothetical protein